MTTCVTPSILIYVPSILFLTDIVASSNSTDETIVVDSDVEIDTATSDHTVAASKSEHHIEHISDDKKEVVAISEEDAVNLVEAKTSINLHSDQEKDEIVKPMEEDVKVIEKTATMRGFKVEGEDIPVMTKVPKDETLDSRDETCHVIYTQNLVVKSILQSARAESIETGGINFKRFRKVIFYIPFSCNILYAQTTEWQNINYGAFQLFREEQCLETASRT